MSYFNFIKSNPYVVPESVMNSRRFKSCLQEPSVAANPLESLAPFALKNIVQCS